MVSDDFFDLLFSLKLGGGFGGFKCFLFSPLLGGDSHFDFLTDIFQMGSNHQLVKLEEMNPILLECFFNWVASDHYGGNTWNLEYFGSNPPPSDSGKLYAGILC